MVGEISKLGWEFLTSSLYQDINLVVNEFGIYNSKTDEAFRLYAGSDNGIKIVRCTSIGEDDIVFDGIIHTKEDLERIMDLTGIIVNLK